MVGGYDTDLSKYSTAIRMYDSTTNSWEIISHMTIARRHCYTAVLPDNQLMVVGGFIGPVAKFRATTTVEIASIIK